MASNLKAIASNLVGMASNLRAMALLAMASKFLKLFCFRIDLRMGFSEDSQTPSHDLCLLRSCGQQIDSQSRWLVPTLLK